MIFDDWKREQNAPSSSLDWHLPYWIFRAHSEPLWFKDIIWRREVEA